MSRWRSRATYEGFGARPELRRGGEIGPVRLKRVGLARTALALSVATVFPFLLCAMQQSEGGGPLPEARALLREARESSDPAHAHSAVRRAIDLLRNSPGLTNNEEALDHLQACGLFALDRLFDPDSALEAFDPVRRAREATLAQGDPARIAIQEHSARARGMRGDHKVGIAGLS